MHRKSLEAAEHLKEDGCNSDREETNSLRTDTSDTSINSGQQSSTTTTTTTTTTGPPLAPGGSPHPPNITPHPGGPEKDRNQTQQNNNAPPQQHTTMQPTNLSASAHGYPSVNVGVGVGAGDDPEAFRNNSIACLRAKAQEHSAKLLNHGLMLQVRSLTSMAHAHGHAQPPPCDANANNLHHGDLINSDTNTSSSMF